MEDLVGVVHHSLSEMCDHSMSPCPNYANHQIMAAAAKGDALPLKGADLGGGGRQFTLRSVSAVAEAYARLAYRHVPLFRVLSAWLQVGVNE